MRPLLGASGLKGRGLTSLGSTPAGHQTCPGTERASVAQSRVGIRARPPSRKTNDLPREVCWSAPVNFARRMHGCAQWGPRPPRCRIAGGDVEPYLVAGGTDLMVDDEAVGDVVADCEKHAVGRRLDDVGAVADDRLLPVGIGRS